MWRINWIMCPSVIFVNQLWFLWHNYGLSVTKVMFLYKIERLNTWPAVLGHFWCNFDLANRVTFRVSGPYLQNAWKKWPEIWYAVSWPLAEVIRFGHDLVISIIVVQFWPNETGQMYVSGHFLDNAWRNGVKFGILIYHDHPQKWLDFYGLFTFKILAQFDLVEREKWVFLGIFLRTQGGTALNLAWWYIVTVFRTD